MAGVTTQSSSLIHYTINIIDAHRFIAVRRVLSCCFARFLFYVKHISSPPLYVPCWLCCPFARQNLNLSPLFTVLGMKPRASLARIREETADRESLMFIAAVSVCARDSSGSSGPVLIIFASSLFFIERHKIIIQIGIP